YAKPAENRLAADPTGTRRRGRGAWESYEYAWPQVEHRTSQGPATMRLRHLKAPGVTCAQARANAASLARRISAAPMRLPHRLHRVRATERISHHSLSAR